jgi:hypothetical protein
MKNITYKTVCTNGLPGDEHMMRKTCIRCWELNLNIHLKSVHWLVYISQLCHIAQYKKHQIHEVVKWPTNASRNWLDLLRYSRFISTCFGKSVPSSGGRRCLRSYLSDICIVDVYGLRSVQCGHFSGNVWCICWSFYDTTKMLSPTIKMKSVS